MGWRQNVVIATLVIVEGTGGGLFVYNGTPGPANPPVFSVVAPGVTQDPYGNTVSAVMQAGVPGSGQTQIDQSGDILLSGADGSQVIRLNPSHQRILLYADPAGAGQLQSSIAIASGTDDFGTTYLPGFESQTTSAGKTFVANMFAGSLQIGLVGGAGSSLGIINGGSAAGILQVASGTNNGTDVAAIIDMVSQQASGNGVPVVAIEGNSSILQANGFLSVLALGTGSNSIAGATTFTGNITAGKVALSGGGTNPLLTVTDTTASPGNPNIDVINAAAGDRGLGLRVTGDTVDRLVLRSDNSINFGSGSAATDTVIYRGAAGQLVADYIAHNESGSPETWHTPTLGNSWTNSGQGPVMQYRHVAAPYNCLQLVGDLTGGTLTDGTVIFTLPAGYRPATGQTCPFMVPGTNAAANMRFQVNTSGAVLIEGLSGLSAGPRVIIPASTLISLDA